MSNESSQPSTPLNSAVDLSVVRVLRVLDPIARSSGCEYFLAGATARDLILVNVHGLRPGRATRDIDFGIAVESWAQFELLKEGLLATNDFSASRAQQRLTFTDSNEGISIPVDLIPFRGVASADGTIAWPPGRDIVMNVAGFEEALTSSVLIEIEANLTVHVASVAGLTLLKLAAWVDRGRKQQRRRRPVPIADFLRRRREHGSPVRHGVGFVGSCGVRHAVGGRGTSRSRCRGNMRCPDTASSPVHPGGGR